MIINKIEFSRDQIEKLALESSNKTEFAEKLGFTFFNGKVSKKISDLLSKLNIDVNLETFSKKRKSLIKYPLIKKVCPLCNNEFETSLGHPKEKTTCSFNCSNIYFSSSRNSIEKNKKISSSLIKRNDKILGEDRNTKICEICNLTFNTLHKKQKCCSIKCISIFRSTNIEYKSKLSASMQKRISNGTHKGWAKRSNLEPSYPEKYILNLLEELNIANFTRELKVNKWFIDFAFNNKVALEIDGKQHEFPERKISDANKDAHLKSVGWKVIRLKWKKITKEFREEIISLIENNILKVV